MASQLASVRRPGQSLAWAVHIWFQDRKVPVWIPPAVRRKCWLQLLPEPSPLTRMPTASRAEQDATILKFLHSNNSGVSNKVTLMNALVLCEWPQETSNAASAGSACVEETLEVSKRGPRALPGGAYPTNTAVRQMDKPPETVHEQSHSQRSTKAGRQAWSWMLRMDLIQVRLLCVGLHIDD